MTVASRQAYDAQVQRSDAQQSFGDLLVLGVIAALATVTLVNTLAVATFERRRSVRLLVRTGATPRQVAGMFGCHDLCVTATGIGAGALMAAGVLAAVDKATRGACEPRVARPPCTTIGPRPTAPTESCQARQMRALPVPCGNDY